MQVIANEKGIIVTKKVFNITIKKHEIDYKEITGINETEMRRVYGVKGRYLEIKNKKKIRVKVWEDNTNSYSLLKTKIEYQTGLKAKTDIKISRY